MLDLYNEINDDKIEFIENQNEIKENKNEIIINNDEINEDSIEINYKPNNNNEKLRIFGNKFVKNNLNKCKIIYKNIEYNICEYINEIDNEYDNTDIIKIKLKYYNKIKDMSYVFSNCTELFSLS